MTHPPETPSFLAAVKRIEALTQEIRRDGLSAFEKAEAAYTEVQELRAVLNARISELRRRSA
ncbi:hypothetical protein Mpop_0326 [Methylorubrum populi BJ001]|jgi:hypothetical protein|uniref:Uncharacterized protein n=1 Tax=Methylorubrum populi (strain ATCC BAA-705 / NCIMB 13946 / BJ001) TaxID=441620 RepID=B1ZI21_METPB|nr:hypothetical protein [Methylorubrum populi]ACB78507.1 hypothetical protein Mpop_0326 [Methylorubrum populi BJ001]OAH35141.1 hypothetical protein AX289_20885 [Methylorubrum populi]PZP65507.1 MAG: hypothetical protein DI590_26880 [Methylorubrum populi]